MPVISVATQTSTASDSEAPLMVAWLRESRSSPITTAPGRRATCEELGHPLDGQIGVEQRTGRRGQLEDLDQVGGVAPPFEAADHREVRLEPVEPGQERHPDLVRRRGGLEDLAAQHLGRPHHRVVRREVTDVERVQRVGGRRGDRREGSEQGIAVAGLRRRGSAPRS